MIICVVELFVVENGDYGQMVHFQMLWEITDQSLEININEECKCISHLLLCY